MINDWDIRTISNSSRISRELCNYRNFRTAGTPEIHHKQRTFGVLRSWADLSASARPPVLAAGSGGAGGAAADGTDTMSCWTALSDGTRNRLGSAACDNRWVNPGAMSSTLPDDADLRCDLFSWSPMLYTYMVAQTSDNISFKLFNCIHNSLSILQIYLLSRLAIWRHN